MFKSESNRKYNRKTRKKKKENKVKNDQNMYLFNNTVATSKDRVTFCAAQIVHLVPLQLLNLYGAYFKLF